MAEEDVRQILRDTASVLDAVLYGDSETYRVTRAGPQRYLFLTSPPDLRLWTSGDSVHLVCLTDNKAQTFWSFVAEKKEDETLAAQAARWTHAPRTADRFEGLNVASLPGGGCVHLQSALLPAHFDLPLVEAYGIPSYGLNAPVFNHSSERLNMIRTALAQQRQLTDAVVAAYQGLRVWAKNAGLCHINPKSENEEFILPLLLQLGDQGDLEERFINTYSNTVDISLAPSSTQNPRNVAQIADIARELSRVVNNRAIYYASAAEHSKLFRQDHLQFLQLRCRCWTPSMYPSFSNTLLETAITIRQDLISAKADPGRLWPQMFTPAEITKSSDDLIVVLLIGLRSEISQTNTEMIRTVVDAYKVEHWAKLERETYQIEVSMETQATVLEYQSAPLSAASGAAPSTVTNTTQLEVVQAETTKPKLRPAGQTLSRLRWDPAHRSQHYEVGYLDRFDGLKWIRLEEWGRSVEEDDFIPEHRIQQVRRTSNHQTVWDRAKRLDLTGQT